MSIVDDRFVYHCIRRFFQVCAISFYSSFDVRGLENLPAEGEPTLLCFNHGNSLTDSVVLISQTPRVIRFCAKNTLWDMPVVGSLIKGSGAVPVFRRREHGDKATEFNVDTFKAVYGALAKGNCVGFSPEGASSFRSEAFKFKDGVAYIALEAVEQALARGDKDFKINIVPAVMVWTHREKFRSDVMLRYRPPIVVDASYVKPGVPHKQAAKEIIAMLEAEYHENILSAPDWQAARLAIAATRIQRPLGTFMSLSTYMYFLRGWMQIFKMPAETPLKPLARETAKRIESVAAATGSEAKDARTVGEVLASLHEYQKMLELVKVKDDRIRRIEMNGGVRPSMMRCLRIIAYRMTLCSTLFTVAAPGLAIWSPVWFLIKRKERSLLSKGVGWVDSVAENKMIVGFFGLLTMGVLFNVAAPVVFLYLWLTMRLYEEAVASARSICGIYRLMVISGRDLRKLLALRLRAKWHVLQAVSLFPKSSADRIMEECGDDVYADKSTEDVGRPRWWTNFNPMRRRKKDWNEVLRLMDHATMDYVE
ncbi:Glycerol-3-phosphate O-acyltransferase 1 [Hondaea fermentalgiana]|uniref:Glycerol-3-phosphate O-acyltransferase 1 n=1 Tax=Hondaea fermentalgiana TaxID=2315210 RepID=A0A2R5GMB5_9STRA|nr:Glycerol-3-phosphate O-acyltransferase 1 [Hondaea fermentalgiana]|eukprot:GBG31449.1 Glycerol-3-phosphate O-acyltransferase 1 [Hondaea fermentalgiana]